MILASWQRRERLNNGEFAARHAGATTETVRRWNLPPGHAERCIPRGRKMERIIELTAGEVTPNDWYWYVPALRHALLAEAAA